MVVFLGLQARDLKTIEALLSFILKAGALRVGLIKFSFALYFSFFLIRARFETGFATALALLGSASSFFLAALRAFFLIESIF